MYDKNLNLVKNFLFLKRHLKDTIVFNMKRTCKF